MAKPQSKINVKRAYDEIGTNYRFFLTWRHRLLGGYLAVLAGAGIAFSWSHTNNPRLLRLIQFLICGITVVFWLFDLRNRDLYHACQEAGADCERDLPPEAGIYTRLVGARRKWLTHSHAFDLLFSLVLSLVILTMVFPIGAPLTSAPAPASTEQALGDSPKGWQSIGKWVTEKAIEFIAFGIGLSVFFTAWANHLLGVYNDPPTKPSGIDCEEIQRVHARCWHIALTGNFAALSATACLLLVATLNEGDAISLLGFSIVLFYALVSIYPWFFVAPLRLNKNHRGFRVLRANTPSIAATDKVTWPEASTSKDIDV